MRIRFVTLYYHPEVGAAQRRLSDLAERLSRRGHTVTILTGFPNYPSGKKPDGYRRKLFMREICGNVTILRVPHYVAPNKGFFKRLLIHLTYAFSASLCTLFMKRDDIAYLESPPLFNGFIGLAGKWFRGMPYFFNVADLWPDTAVEMGLLTNRTVIQLSLFLERFFYLRAARILAITEGVRSRILAKGYRQENVPLITNGVDPEVFTAEAAPDPSISAYRKDNGLLVVYAGTHGLIYSLDTVLKAAHEVAGENISFVFIGDGADKERLVKLADEMKLTNVTFLPPRPQQEMPGVFRAADLAVVALKALPVSRAIMPVKCFEIMAVGTPIILAAEGEMARHITAAGCGEVIPSENVVALTAALRRYRAMSSEQRSAIGLRGRPFVVRHFSRETIAVNLETLMRGVADYDR
jgi:glycosyltransferase involved in cell wall biosynthesis